MPEAGIVEDTKRPDPNLWLEDAHGPEAITWAARMSEDARGRLQAGDLYPLVEGELRDTLAGVAPTPEMFYIGGTLAMLYRDSERPHGILRVAEIDDAGAPGPWRDVFDVGAFGEARGKTYQLKTRMLPRMGFPPTFRRCLLPLSPAGMDDAELHELDLVTGELVDGGFHLANCPVDAVCLSPDHVLVAHALDGAPRSAAGRPATAYLWKRGTAIADALPVVTLAPQDAMMTLSVAGAGAERRAIVTLIHDLATFSFVTIGIDGEAKPVALPTKLKPFPILAATSTHILVQLGEPAEIAGRLVTAESLIAWDIRPGTLEESRATVVHSFVDQEFANDTNFGFAGALDRFYFVTDKRSRRALYSAHLADAEWTVERVFEGEPGVTLKLGFDDGGGDKTRDSLLLFQTGYLTPTRIDLLRLNQKTLPLHQDEEAFDATRFVVEVGSATSRDGTAIDYYLLRPRAAEGPVPTLITGYGGFGATFYPAYFDEIVGGRSLKIWLDRGGALAMPLIRGGGDRGAEWHLAAQRERRQNAYDDFLAAAQQLVADGFTTPERLGAFGTSNGGLLVAAAALQRPDLFGAVVSDAPILDMLRYHLMGIGGGMMTEYGNPDEPEMHAALAAYSPYHNLRPHTDFPPFLVTVSTEDDRVGPGHARKFVARAKSLGLPVDLIEEPSGGHGLSNPSTHPELMAIRMAFFIRELMDNGASSATAWGGSVA